MGQTLFEQNKNQGIVINEFTESSIAVFASKRNVLHKDSHLDSDSRSFSYL